MTGCPGGNGPGHVGGAGLVFDSAGDLYLGVGDDVSPNEGGHGAYPPLDYRASGAPRRAQDRRPTPNDLRGKIIRIHPLDEIAPGAEPGAGTTYIDPRRETCSSRRRPNTRPEIFAMGFRQPFTLHTDPANPGTVAVGEYCHDSGIRPCRQRAPAGGCEWNLLSEPGLPRLAVLRRRQLAGEQLLPLGLRHRDAAPGSQYDCSLEDMPDRPRLRARGPVRSPGPTIRRTWRDLPGPGGPGDDLEEDSHNQQPVE